MYAFLYCRTFCSGPTDAVVPSATAARVRGPHEREVAERTTWHDLERRDEPRSRDASVIGPRARLASSRRPVTRLVSSLGCQCRTIIPNLASEEVAEGARAPEEDGAGRDADAEDAAAPDGAVAPATEVSRDGSPPVERPPLGAADARVVTSDDHEAGATWSSDSSPRGVKRTLDDAARDQGQGRGRHRRCLSHGVAIDGADERRSPLGGLQTPRTLARDAPPRRLGPEDFQRERGARLRRVRLGRREDRRERPSCPSFAQSRSRRQARDRPSHAHDKSLALAKSYWEEVVLPIYKTADPLDREASDPRSSASPPRGSRRARAPLAS